MMSKVPRGNIFDEIPDTYTDVKEKQNTTEHKQCEEVSLLLLVSVFSFSLICDCF
jgi:hypothetical protein